MTNPTFGDQVGSLCLNHLELEYSSSTGCINRKGFFVERPVNLSQSIYPLISPIISHNHGNSNSFVFFEYISFTLENEDFYPATFLGKTLVPY